MRVCNAGSHPTAETQARGHVPPSPRRGQPTSSLAFGSSRPGVCCAALSASLALVASACGPRSQEGAEGGELATRASEVSGGDVAAVVNGMPIGAPSLSALAWRMLEHGSLPADGVAPPDGAYAGVGAPPTIETVVREALLRLAAARLLEAGPRMGAPELAYLDRIALVRSYLETMPRESGDSSEALTPERLAEDGRLLSSKVRVTLYESNLRLVPRLDGSGQHAEAQSAPR